MKDLIASTRFALRLLERVFYKNSEVFLTRIHVLRPYKAAGRSFSSGNNHSVVKINPVGSMCFYGAAYEGSIGRHNSKRSQYVEDRQ